MINTIYKHVSGFSVEVIAIANVNSNDERPVTVVYKVLLSNEIFTDDIDTFTKEYKVLEINEQDIFKDFIA